MLQKLGAIRVLLLLAVGLCAPLAAFADAEPAGWGVWGAYVGPSMAVILFFLLWLDVLMNKVFAIDLPKDQRGLQRLRTRADLLGLLVILASWGPFYYSLLER